MKLSPIPLFQGIFNTKTTLCAHFFREALTAFVLHGLIALWPRDAAANRLYVCP